MARPVWNGTLSFGLVAIPVKLYHAVRKKSVAFNQLDERNLARIRYRKVNAETGDEVSDDHIVKGYEISKGRYVVIDPDELEPFMPAVTKTVDLEEFVDLDDIDPVYFDTAYHLAPDTNPKPYALLARAMEASGKVAIIADDNDADGIEGNHETATNVLMGDLSTRRLELVELMDKGELPNDESITFIPVGHADKVSSKTV